MRTANIEWIEPIESLDTFERRGYKIELRDVTEIESRLSVTDLAYSLKKIYNFDRPRSHFGMPYGWISEEDYYTISSSTIFYARTAFLSFFLSLPQDLQLEFRRETFPLTVDTSNEPFPYKLRWEQLLEYLNKRIFSIGNILNRIDDLWPELLDSQTSLNESLYFGTDKEEPESLVDAFDLFNESWLSLLNEETDREREDWLKSPLIRKTNKRISEEEQTLMENRFRFEKQWPTPAS